MGFFLGSRLSVFVIVAVAGFVAYDINKYGSFRASKTGVFLRDCGVLRYGELALTRFRSYSQQAYRWSQKHVPGYMSFMRESLAVYLIIIRDVVTRLATHLWANISQIWHYFVDKKPAVVKWLNEYLPGVSDSVSSWLSQGWSLLLQYATIVIQWLKDNVFVGSLSPENLQRLSWEALNTTQTLARQTLSWINGKMAPVIVGSST
ncbi:uncharacterized protein LOC124355314 [Homalodisca vitripennis]|uniref:uncharacterized protein LOC124355314 n=1 Tax=Homalodisca vitripennis TaxID=197043 RepID=UPI001EEC51F0|nr:uncharacterized protein LOC124355314 [Homalodisca vitripennis]XP_046662362.1 uncharacterized protein LOC124355314 [Homalodisca vitripennis]